MGGRPTVVTGRKLAAALAIRDQGDLTMTQIAEKLGVSPGSDSSARVEDLRPGPPHRISPDQSLAADHRRTTDRGAGGGT